MPRRTFGSKGNTRAGKRAKKLGEPAYSDLSAERQAELYKEGQEILSTFGKDIPSWLMSCKRLVFVRETIGHGQFLTWIEVGLNSQISPSTAENYMNAHRVTDAYYKKTGKVPNFGNLSRSSMYLLAIKGLSEEVINEIFDLSIQRPVPYGEVKKLVDEALKPIRAARKETREAKAKAGTGTDKQDDPTPGPRDLPREYFRGVCLRIIDRLGQHEAEDVLFDDIQSMVIHYDLTITVEARFNPRHILQFDFSQDRQRSGANETGNSSKPAEPSPGNAQPSSYEDYLQRIAKEAADAARAAESVASPSPQESSSPARREGPVTDEELIEEGYWPSR